MRVTHVNVMKRTRLVTLWWLSLLYSLEPRAVTSVRSPIGGVRSKQSLQVEKRAVAEHGGGVGKEGSGGGSVVRGHPWLDIVNLRRAWAT